MVVAAEKAELERRVDRLGRMLLCSRIREGRGPQQSESVLSRGFVRSASLDSGVRHVGSGHGINAAASMSFVAHVSSRTCSSVPLATVKCRCSMGADKGVQHRENRTTFAAILCEPASGVDSTQGHAPQMTRERLLGGSPLALQQPASGAQPGGNDALTPCSRRVAGPEATSCSKGAQRWLSCTKQGTSECLQKQNDFRKNHSSFKTNLSILDKRMCAGCTVTGATHISVVQDSD